MGVKPSCIRFNKVYEVSKIYGRARSLELFDSWIYNRICDKIL